MFGQSKFTSLVLLAFGAVHSVHATPIPDGDVASVEILPEAPSIAHIGALDDDVDVNVGGGGTLKFPSPGSFGSGSFQKRGIVADVDLVPGAASIADVDVLGAVTAKVGGEDEPLPIVGSGFGSTSTSTQKRGTIAGVELLPGADDIANVDLLGDGVTVDVGGSQSNGGTLSKFAGDAGGSSTSQKRDNVAAVDVLPDAPKIAGIDILKDTVDVNVGGESTPPFSFGGDQKNPSTKRLVKRQPLPPFTNSGSNQDDHDPFAALDDEGDNISGTNYPGYAPYRPFFGSGPNSGPNGPPPNGPNGFPPNGPPPNGPPPQKRSVFSFARDV